MCVFMPNMDIPKSVEAVQKERNTCPSTCFIKKLIIQIPQNADLIDVWNYEQTQ